MIINGNSTEEQYKNIHSFAAIARAQFKNKPQQCKFFQKEVISGGIKVTPQGLHKIEGKVNAVKEAPRPQNKFKLGSFLGLVNYLP